jgi:hypothetical protein
METYASQKMNPFSDDPVIRQAQVRAEQLTLSMIYHANKIKRLEKMGMDYTTQVRLIRQHERCFNRISMKRAYMLQGIRCLQDV